MICSHGISFFVDVNVQVALRQGAFRVTTGDTGRQDTAVSAKQIAEAEVLKENSPHKLSQFSSGEDITDQRPPLCSDALLQGRTRCAVFTCSGILNSNETDCHLCDSPRLELCQCTECFASYDPNRVIKCNIGSCGRLFPHHPRYARQVETDRALEKDETKDTSKTASKLASLKDSLRLKAVLRDTSRGKPSVMVRNITNATDMFDTLAEVSTRSSNDTDRNKPPLKDLTCVVTFDLLKKVSAAKYGLFTKGRLSLWQCCKTRGGWRATKFYNREVDSTAKVMTQAELKKLAAKLMKTLL